MGYTNYWKPKKLDMKDIPSQFWEDAAEVLDMVISKGVILAGVHGDTRLSCGKEIIENSKQYEEQEGGPCLFFNGYCDPEGDDDSYETFGLCFNGAWNFCKTARLPYDLAVKCILMLAEQYDLLMNEDDIRDDIDIDVSPWSFDGGKDDEEYIDAAEIMTAFNIKKQLNK